MSDKKEKLRKKAHIKKPKIFVETTITFAVKKECGKEKLQILEKSGRLRYFSLRNAVTSDTCFIQDTDYSADSNSAPHGQFQEEDNKRWFLNWKYSFGIVSDEHNDSDTGISNLIIRKQCRLKFSKPSPVGWIPSLNTSFSEQSPIYYNKTENSNKLVTTPLEPSFAIRVEWIAKFSLVL